MDLERRIRKINKILGLEILLLRDDAGKPAILQVEDPELGEVFTVALTWPSLYVQQADILHGLVYKRRGQEVFRRQKGLCCFCGEPMQGTENTEIDHKESRGAHGRNDRMENLRATCGGFSWNGGPSCHRKRHGDK